MPITAVFDRSIVEQAARAEDLGADRVRAILAEMPAGWLKSLANHLSEPGASGSGLDEWRKAWPTILKTGDDAGDSFLIRVAAAAAGGVTV